MIYFKPVINAETPAQVKFEAIENDNVNGECILLLENHKATLTHLTFDEDKPYLVEGLIRSAFNYASLKNYYMGYCSCENVSSFFDKMNFHKENGIYYNDIPSILMGNCCKSKDNI